MGQLIDRCVEPAQRHRSANGDGKIELINSQ
jgi:hypothetical protein